MGPGCSPERITFSTYGSSDLLRTGRLIRPKSVRFGAETHTVTGPFPGVEDRSGGKAGDRVQELWMGGRDSEVLKLRGAVLESRYRRI